MGKLTLRLTDATRSGVYRAPRSDEIVDAAIGTRLDLARVDLAGRRTRRPRSGALPRRLPCRSGSAATGMRWKTALRTCPGELGPAT